MEDQEQAKKAEKKRKQHEAYKRWYAKHGKEYYKKRLVREALKAAK